jgi:hypothetical protein
MAPYLRTLQKGKISSFAHGTNALMSIQINATKNYIESTFQITFVFTR